MTTNLLNQLKQLHTQSTDSEDRAFLSAILNLNEAAEAQPTDDIRRICAACKDTYPALLGNKGGLCPGCELLWMHDEFRRRREESRAAQVFHGLMTREW